MLLAAAVRHGGGSVVLAAGGWAAVGATGGVIGGTAGLVGTYLALRSNARTARREYNAEIKAAHDTGVTEATANLGSIIDNLSDRIEQTRQTANDRVAALQTDLTAARADAAEWRRIALGKGNDGGQRPPEQPGN